jgi:hypothetical protein
MRARAPRRRTGAADRTPAASRRPERGSPVRERPDDKDTKFAKDTKPFAFPKVDFVSFLRFVWMSA